MAPLVSTGLPLDRGIESTFGRARETID